MKYEREFCSFFSKQPLFTSKDVARFLGIMGASNSYVRLFLHNSVKRGKILRYQKGVYSFQRNEALFGYVYRPFYYGLEYALTIRKIWAYQTNPVVITTTTANPGIRKILGVSFTVRRIRKEQFFGYEYIKHDGIFVPVSEPEKILLDFVYFRKRMDPETMVSLISLCNRQKLNRYLMRLSNHQKRGVEKVITKYGYKFHGNLR